MNFIHHSEKLEHNAKLLLTVSLLFSLASALSNTFVNVYLWKIESDYSLIGLYNFFNYFMVPFSFLIAGKFAKRYSRTLPLRAGVISLSLFYLGVLLLGKSAVTFIIPLGLALGFGSGLFWLAVNVLYIEVTSPSNRDVFNGLNGFLTSGAGIVAPLISGYIIVRSEGFIGYEIIFTVSLAIFIIAIIASFFIKRKKSTGRLTMRGVWENCFKLSTPWGKMMIALFFQGMREGIFFFFIGLLVFVVTSNELKLGTFATVSSIVSLIFYFIVGKIMRPLWRMKFIWIGAIGLFLVMIPLLIDLNYATLFILGIGIAIFFPIYIIPFTSVVFDLIGKDEERGKLRVEYIIARETALNVGRMVSVGLFIILVSITTDIVYLKWFAIVIGSVQLWAAWFTPRTEYVPAERHATLFHTNRLKH